ncbi:MAG TPA: S41 family peptidase [Myxococcota bacterium]|nr:S41 family peptidase [Myxococcota bacterium]
MTLRRILRSLALLSSLIVAVPAAAELDCPSISQLAREFLKHHVIQSALGTELEQRAIESYLHRLDTSRSLMLESEVGELRAKLAGVFENLQAGNCSQIQAVHERLIAMQAASEAHAKALVADENFKLDESVEIRIDPDQRGYPKTNEERNELWRKLVHFQMSNYLGAGEKLPEAKRLLAHRYELRTKRLRELPQWEIFSIFLDSFATALDPHSNYLSPEAVEDFRISMSLSLEGIGVALSERDGYSVVERIIPGGAADRIEHGLEPNDKIIAVAEDGGEAVNIVDMPLREAVSLIRGKKGTKVHLTVLRQGDETQRFPLAIVRDKIDLSEQAASLRFETRERHGKPFKLAIIDLPSFYGDSDPGQRQCTDDVENLLKQVKEAKADGLLLDLSRNGGGLLEHAVKISGFFIRKGEIVGVENARRQMSVLADRDERILYTGPMVVHVSRVSASASEILAGALKDYHRAVITGDDHTFGKGTVQTVTPLPPGLGALKITTARFFRPGGQSTQNDGVAADVVIPSLLATDDLGEKNQPFALAGESRAALYSSFANAIGPSDLDSQVSGAELAELVRSSSERVAKSPAFEEVRVKLAEQRAHQGIVRLSDIIKEREESKVGDAKGNGSNGNGANGNGKKGDKGAGAKNGDGKKQAKGEDAEDHDPQVEEAVEVLADLVAMAHHGPGAEAVARGQ